ncbi:peroxiredoxin-like family protein [Amnibacterium setariae]|uniref:thioredoxin-dependent peroxiredoxin n=1 Tax=Amnibacterium setariae TaxID=2306585 RepID=A0A3A1U2V1_9MICO|nr:peroxiredoxin-like family protein [Amnibacterium setariae]RIX28816.1 AhpC/TSA family protein [Amnibacterium setariae]
MSGQSIAEQVDTFNGGFNEQIGPVLADVFAQEQAALTAAGVPDGAVREGDTVPDAALVRTDGSAVALADVLGGRPAVLVFYRGAWCPYCNIALQTYQRDLLPALADRGVELVAISPQTPEGSEQAVANGGLEFTVLSDPSNALVRGLGILTEPSGEARQAHTQLGFDVADSNADATGDIPFPTVLVVDGDRVVRFADVHVDYTTRTEVPTILEAVERLRPA